MKLVMRESKPIPVGQYIARVIKVESEEGNFGRQFKFTFEIIEPTAYSGKEILGWASQKDSLKGKFAKWAGACLGRALQPDDNVDTDKLVGCMVTLIVTIKEKDDGTEFNKVDNVKPYIKPKQEIETSTAAEDDEDPF